MNAIVLGLLKKAFVKKEVLEYYIKPLLQQPVLEGYLAKLIAWAKAEAAKTETPVDDSIVKALETVGPVIIKLLITYGPKLIELILKLIGG